MSTVSFVPLADLVEHSLGGDWGQDPSDQADGYVAVKVVRGTDFTRWQSHRASGAADRRIKVTSLEKRRLREGDLIVEASGGGPTQPVGRVVMIDKPALEGTNAPLVCSNFFRQLRLVQSVDPRYVERYLRLEYLRGKLDEFQTQTTNLRNLRFDDFLNGISIPIRDINEQRLIARKLDHIAAHLDDTRTRLDTIPSILKRFRMSVLAAACSGRLTEDWRKKRGIDIESWQATTMAELACLITSGSRGWAKYYSPSGALFVRAQNINTDKLILDDIAYVSPPKNSEGARTRVLIGDLLVTITGANVTKTALVENDLGEAYVSQHVGLVRLKNSELAPYVYLWLSNGAPGRTQLLDAAYGAGKPGLSLGNLRDVAVLLPSEAERSEIFRQVTNLLTQAEIIETRYRNAKTFTDKLMPAVLAKAFRGELIEQSEEGIRHG